MRKFLFILFVLFLQIFPGLFTPSCDTNRGEIIPYVRVDFYLLIYADLADLGIGTTKLIPGEGYKGIALYRESDLVEDSSFFGVFECPECGSTYLLMNGAEPNSGPARYPLVEYHTSIQGDVLHIHN